MASSSALQPHPASLPGETPGAPGGVTGNESWAALAPPPQGDWTPAALGDAQRLSLGATAISPGALELVGTITQALIDREARTRGNRRGTAGRASLTRAVGAVLGGVLAAWAGKRSRAVFRTRVAASFTGGMVGHRQFVAVVGGLQALGMLGHAPGLRFRIDWGDDFSQHGLASRYRPTGALLDTAQAHGVVPATITTDFLASFSTKPPVVGALVVLRALGDRWGGQRKRSGPAAKRDMPIGPGDPVARRLRAEVGAFNAFVADHDVTGCLPPRWRRIFALDWDHGGRWYAAGHDGPYQTLGAAARLAMTIGGAPVVEIDARASHLMIMHGLFGLPAPEGDPYAIEGLTGERETVKEWIKTTLGKGTPATKWARNAPPAVRERDARMVGAAILARYPFLSDPSQATAWPGSVGERRRHLTHRLVNLEATALTVAMTLLRRQGVLALPMHDGLIVAATAEAMAKAAMVAGYSEAAGVVPALTVERPSLPP